MHDQCAIIHDRTLRLWVIQAKKIVDPDNTFSFKASQSWCTLFKRKHRVVSRAITHRVGRNWKNKEEDRRRICDLNSGANQETSDRSVY